MTTTTTQTLINRIRSVLATAGGDDASALEVAREFAELCSDASERLGQCKRLEDVEGAVATAEQEPALIEIFESLGRFDAADRWIAHCEAHSLPVAPSFDSGATGWLVGLYRKWAGTSEFLWKKYRDAVLRKDERVALAVARRILKLDPSDRAAREETNRILRRHFREKLRDLEELVDCGDQRAALELADQLDRLPFDKLKKGKAWDTAVVWRDAQKRSSDEKKSAGLIAGMDAQCGARDLDGAKDTVTAVQVIVKTHSFKLDEESRGQLEKTEAWIVEEEARRKREAGSKEIVDRCTSELSKIQANWPVLIGSPLAELEGAGRKLSNCWSEVDKIGGGIGSDIATRVKGRLAQIDSAVAKLKRKRRRKRRIAVCAVAFVAFAVGFFFYAQWRGAWMVEEFARYKKERKAIPFKKLVASSNTYRWPIARLAQIDPDLKRARAWLDREYGDKDGIEARIAELDKETADTFPRPIEIYWNEVEEIKNNTATAAVDLRPLINKKMAPFKTKWDAHVDAYVAELRQRRARALEETSKILTGAPRLNLAARDDSWFGRVTKATAELPDAMQTVIPPAEPLKDVALKAADVGPQLTELHKRMTLFREALLATKSAASYNNFVSAMQRFRDGPFKETPESDAAISMVAEAKREPQLIGDIFAPGNPQAWAAFGASRGKADIFPKTVEEDERVILEALSTDETMENLYLCRFRDVKSGKTTVRYSVGPTRLRNRRVGPMKIVESSGEFFNAGAFTYAKYEVKEGRGMRLAGEGQSIETDLFLKIRPNDRVMGQSQQYYRTGLLETFDDILSAEDAHPLFKAYLYIEFGKVIAKRPDEWGPMFAPQLLRDLETVNESMPLVLRSTDWMWPGKHAARAAILRQFFAARRGHRYALESRINRRLIESALAAGFDLAGYVDIDGTLELRPAAESTAILYGTPRPGASAKVLFRRTDESAKPADDADIFSDNSTPGWRALENVAPFTPLIYFKGDHDELVAAVAAEEGISIDSVRSMALPIFLAEESPQASEAEAEGVPSLNE